VFHRKELGRRGKGKGSELERRGQEEDRFEEGKVSKHEKWGKRRQGERTRGKERQR